MKEETMQKVRNVYQREFHNLPLAKDLPRLAKFVSICNEDGVRLSYSESKRLDIEQYITERGTDFKIFYQVRRVLLTLCFALEGQGKCLEADRALLKLLDEEDALIPPVINSFLDKHFGGDIGKVVRILKCVNQAAIAPSLIELKTVMGMENTTKDVAGTWRIFIVVSSDSLTVTHIKKEVCIKNQFQLEWKLSFTLSYNQMDQLRDVSFNVIELSFNPKATSKKIAEVKGTVRAYLHPKVSAEILNGKPKLLLDVVTKVEGVTISSTWPGEVCYLVLQRVHFVHHQLHSQEHSSGTLFVGNYAISFRSEECKFSVPLTAITKCSRKRDCFELSCKDFRVIHFIFVSREDSKQFLEIFGNLLPNHVTQIFADAYCKGLVRNLGPIQSSSFALCKNGWRSYEMEEEFDRMKMTSEWRISDLNTRYQLSETYPGLLAVPRSVSDAELLMSCRCRTGGRVPVLSWIHKNQAILCHGSTTIPGVVNSVRREDEKVLAAIIRTTETQITTPSPVPFRREHTVEISRSKITRKEKLIFKLKKSSPARRYSAPSDDGNLKSHHQFYITDLLYHGQAPIIRDYSAGFPGLPSDLSVGTSCIYVDPISELKESYMKLQRICTSTFQEEDHWLTNLDNTRWLLQIQNIMEGAYHITEIMASGSSVFLSCPGGGWDRGCQISSLAQLWMDPYYRTVDGFAVLIEKEWLSFGHGFLNRSGILVRESEPIPVFIQWLDAVWQTLQQFPNHFEFNNLLLVEIADNAYSGVYGTFLYDNEQSRRNHLARMNTESFWTHIKGNFQYQNPFYVHSHQTLLTSCNFRILSVWTSFYLRWFERTEINDIPNSSLSPTGNDVLGGFTKQKNMTETELLENHISSLEAALLGIQKQLESKYNVHKLLESGLSMDDAIQSVLRVAEEEGKPVTLDPPGPIKSEELRRDARFGSLVCSHKASLQRNSYEPGKTNHLQRTLSVDDGASHKKVNIQRKSASEKMNLLRGRKNEESVSIVD